MPGKLLLLSLLLLSGVAAAQVPAGTTIPQATTIPGTGTAAPPGPMRATPAPGVALRTPPIELRRAPGVTTIGGHTRRDTSGAPSFQYFILTPLEIGLTGLGTAGEVSLLVESLPRTDERRASCRFTTATGNLSAPAVIAPDGTARMVLTGFFQPRTPAGVTTAGRCRLEIVVRRRQTDLSYREENRIAVPEIPVAAHEVVTIGETARLRGFLRPETGCQAADDGGKFGLRITAAVDSAGCRADFLDPRDPRPTMFGYPNMNELPAGVILRGMSWRLDGSQQACELCDNPLIPCRGAAQIPALIVHALVPLKWLYAPLAPSWLSAMPGEAFAVFGGPPQIGRNEAVRVDARTADYDISFAEYLDRMFYGGGDDLSGRDVIGVGDGYWRSWMRPFTIRLQCSSWAPPPSDIGRSIGGALRGQGLQAPAPPSLRLVLDSVTFLRPAGTRVAGE